MKKTLVIKDSIFAGEPNADHKLVASFEGVSIYFDKLEVSKSHYWFRDSNDCAVCLIAISNVDELQYDSKLVYTYNPSL